MVNSNLNLLMAKKKIRSLSELERRLKSENLYISRQSLHKIYHSTALDNTRLDTVLKLLSFFNCSLEDLFIWSSR
ncbi:Uncharacterised protein [Sebaldella termitidis]|uniref:HTH cro/C1-type domain-containing protein n=1 Tax=Sebaldella termitidis (strain ATCC 33386 / NCTC 11300) TaxID=526218 RepID=D1AIN7_SEBTE|nr:helix-turn-helix transcriptional regulator [Sebaldella termitidis]ACZ08621.1 hypothetical protein Sterm_1763 [Sebaldella termitidis ATCC 33386]SUI23937.1 Uncharacterised protein [Sebaldella termitidis]